MSSTRHSGKHGALSSLAIGGVLGLVLAVPGVWAMRHFTRRPSVPFTQAPVAAPAPVFTRTDPIREARLRRTAGLQQLLDEEARSVNGFASIEVRLDDGTEAGVNADYPVDAASVIKVPVMVALYEAWQTGALKRTAADEHRLRLMITRSKNIVTNELIEELGMARINDCLARHGYTQTRVRARILGPEPDGPNTVTAAEITRMFRQIENGELISPSASAEMRRLLLAQHWRERIPSGLPEGVVVGNKTGTLHGVLHDVAFVEAPGGPRYTIAVLIQRVDRSACKSECICDLSRRVFDYLSATQPAGPERLTSLPAGDTGSGAGGWNTTQIESGARP